MKPDLSRAKRTRLLEWVPRRWYRAWVPVLIGSLGFIPVKQRLVDMLWEDPGPVTTIFSSLITGLLAACLTVAVATVCWMQMATVVRAAILVIGWRTAMLIIDDVAWVEFTWLPQAMFFVVGALAAKLLWTPGSERALSGPRSRELGDPNQQGDWLLLTVIILYAIGVNASRGGPRVDEYLKEDLLRSGFFALLGWLMSCITMLSIQQRQGLRYHASSILAVGAMVTALVKLASDAEVLPELSWADVLLISLPVSLVWHAGQYWISRWLAKTGWRFRAKRGSVRLRRDGMLDFQATRRRRELIASRGWTSIAGVFVLIAAGAMLTSMFETSATAGGRATGASQLGQGLFRMTHFSLAMAAVGLIPVVTVAAIGGFWQQCIVTMVCFACLGISFSEIADTDWRDPRNDALLWAFLAIPAVLGIRGLISISDRITRFKFGVAEIDEPPLMIRTIMMWTILAGIQFLVLQSIDWQEKLGIASASLCILGIPLSYIFVRRHLGNRTWLNLLCVVVSVLSLIGGLIAIAVSENINPFLAAFVACSSFACFFATLWLAIGWLQHIGWKALPSKRALRKQSLQAESAIDA